MSAYDQAGVLNVIVVALEPGAPAFKRSLHFCWAAIDLNQGQIALVRCKISA
jgi:hypothetical protein